MRDNQDGASTGHFTAPAFEGDILRKILDAMTGPRRRTHPGRDHARAGHAGNDQARAGHAEAAPHTAASGNDTSSSATSDNDPQQVVSRRRARKNGLLGNGNWIGRTARVFSPAQRTALATRYSHCAAHGCDRPFAWCEIHHLDFWRNEGPTKFGNAAPLCGAHHRMIDRTDTAHRIQRNRGGTITIHLTKRP